MSYKFDIGDRVIGIENTPIKERTEETMEENIINELGTVIGSMGGGEDNIYVVLFDNEINKYNCIFPLAKKNRTTFLHEYQIRKLERWLNA